MSSQPTPWRVSTIEGVFEADLETLKQWIAEGCVLPTDKVSKGNLNWIEAGRAPMLRGAFNGEVVVDPPAVSTAPDVTFSAPPASEAPDLCPAVEKGNSFETGTAPGSVRIASVSGRAACHNHPEIPPKYICRICATTFCRECPRFVGSSNVPLCPLCGDLCKPFAEVQRKAMSREFQGSGFGIDDFKRALRYPLQHKVALLFGAALYGFLLLVGFRGRILASVIMFGCISHVISQVAWGRLNRSFLPDFSSFSVWDDLAVPIGLGIGITIVTWGPMIVLFVALLFGVLSGGLLASSTVSPEAEQQQDLEAISVLANPEANPKQLEEASKRLDKLRPGAQISEQAEKSKNELSDPAADLRLLASYLKAGALIVLLMLLALAWGIFYYPMALTVAGYTQSFGSVINPLVGLDTIRRMGGTYFKAFGMVLVIQVVSFIVAIIVAVITAPFALPFFGNLPATFIDGSLTFYFNLVVACLLGLSLFKCANRLGIEVD
ncbi:MAG: hypothetical protein H7Z16_10240 [Pyrinomonadaceae bacterium]|nr:hypothetical protein [Pyrinomonadaceae bacterium]